MVGGFDSEVERRRHALKLIEEGLTVADAAEAVHRSRRWLSKWKHRSGAGEGIEDRSKAPDHSPTATGSDTVELVLSYRDRLENDPVASIGGMSILAAMERDGIDPIPSERTIERILNRAGRTRPRTKRTRSTVPVLPLPKVGSVPGVWQQADWIQNRYLQGGFVFNSLQVCDVGSQGITAGQYPRRTVLNAVRFLIEDAWPTLSIPQAISVDNAFIKTTHPNNPWTLWTRACLFFGVEVVVSPPGELGWTNTVERVNNLWQERTITRHHCNTLNDVKHYSNLACTWFNTQRPILDPAICGTRYPTEHINNLRDTLRWPPPAILADHLDRNGNLQIPLSQGRITFLRRVENNTILIARTRWTTPNLEDGTLVIASITTADSILNIRHQGEPLVAHRYPIHHNTIKPPYPPHHNSIFHHA